MVFSQNDELTVNNFVLGNNIDAFILMTILIMNKQEIAQMLREDVDQLEVSIKKVQARCDRLKSFVSELEEELAGPVASNRKTIFDTKFGKVIDRVFGEKPKRPKR